ncbi:MAG: hypothetical protein J6T87_00365 [Bacteroidales bacterium]|nr:hypothetical protein [Bacteroidales bacterium]
MKRVRKTSQNLGKTPAHKELNVLTILTVTILELAGQKEADQVAIIAEQEMIEQQNAFLMKAHTKVEETTIILMVCTTNTNIILTRQGGMTDTGKTAEADLMGIDQDLEEMINLFQTTPTRMNIMTIQQRVGVLVGMIPDFQAVLTDIEEKAGADLMGLDQDLKEMINLFQTTPTRMNIMMIQQRFGVLMGMIPDFQVVLIDIEEKAGAELMGLDQDLKEMINLFPTTPTRMNIMMAHQKIWTMKTNETATNVIVEGARGLLTDERAIG